jgi:hypothetical protein
MSCGGCFFEDSDRDQDFDHDRPIRSSLIRSEDSRQGSNISFGPLRSKFSYGFSDGFVLFCETLRGPSQKGRYHTERGRFR